MPETPIEITYYTDPLCSWSWAFEPQWRRLRHALADRLAWRTVMGGMIPDWGAFSDPLQSVDRPAQMGPHWFQVRHLSGMPIEDRIWIEDPPASSYPACLAVKAAERQGREEGETMLRRLREAVLVERRNVARREVLLAVAAEAGLDAGRVAGALDNEALEAFREDLKEVRFHGIGRFPSLVLRGPAGAVIVVGYRPYPVLLEALARVSPDDLPGRQEVEPVEYALHWGSLTAREAAEAAGCPLDEAAARLDAAVARGTLVRTGHLYRRP